MERNQISEQGHEVLATVRLNDISKATKKFIEQEERLDVTEKTPQRTDTGWDLDGYGLNSFPKEEPVQSESKKLDDDAGKQAFIKKHGLDRD